MPNFLKDGSVHEFSFTYLNLTRIYFVHCTANYIDDFKVEFKIFKISCGKRELKGAEYFDEKDYVREHYYGHSRDSKKNEDMKNTIQYAAKKYLTIKN